MPQSLAAVHVHIVFSTKERKPILAARGGRDEAFAYLAETAKRLNCPAIAVGGTDDHVHLLVRLGRTTTIADLVKELKRASTIWMKHVVPNFAWQAGYGAFSVGLSNLDAVETYILGQEEHHRQVDFAEEYRQFLDRHQVKYDERFLWD